MAFCVHCGQQVTEEGTFCQHCGKTKNSFVSSGATAVVAVQKTETEKAFLSTPGATITNTRIIVPGKTYAMAGVTSVHCAEVPAKRGGAILTALIGLLLLFANVALGLVILSIGIIWAFTLKDRYAAAVNSASGEIQAVVSTDQAYISSIVQAVNEAIVYRN
jgi:uncharacterized membrane protein YvbJ